MILFTAITDYKAHSKLSMHFGIVFADGRGGLSTLAILVEGSDTLDPPIGKEKINNVNNLLHKNGHLTRFSGFQHDVFAKNSVASVSFGFTH